MTKYRWIKIKDVTGDTYEFEDCEMHAYFGRILVYYVAPIGVVKKIFFMKNLVSVEYLSETDALSEE